jgi:hypothetical protein
MSGVTTKDGTEILQKVWGSRRRQMAVRSHCLAGAPHA